MADEDKRELSGQEAGSRMAGTLYHVLHYILKLGLLVLLGFCVVYGAKRAYAFGYSVFTSGTVDAAPGKDVDVTITLDMSYRTVGSYLYKKGLIQNAAIFFVQAEIYGYDLQPGDYTLNTSMTIEEMLLVMSEVPEDEE